MKLIDLLSVMSDSSPVLLWNDADEYLGRHNGKDNIDEKYNDFPVVEVSLGNDVIDIVIGGSTV